MNPEKKELNYLKKKKKEQKSEEKNVTKIQGKLNRICCWRENYHSWKLKFTRALISSSDLIIFEKF